MKTIKVTGRGKIRVRPDTTRLTLTVTDVCKTYEEALKRSASDSERIRELFEGFEFDKSDVKTLAFGIEPEYESYKVKDVYKDRLAGYRFRHVMKVEFASDNTRLGKILYALANCDVHPTFRISYTAGDPEAAKNALLGNAVRDAKAKAEVISAAAGVKLKGIENIDYSWGEIDLEVNSVRGFTELRCMKITDEKLDIDIEPDDIEVTDTVTVVWEIG